MQNAFGGLISTLDTTERRISELEDMSVNPPKLKTEKKE